LVKDKQKTIKIPKQRFRIRPTKVHTPKIKKSPKHKEKEQNFYLEEDEVYLIEHLYDY
jgi:hypothetical protein